jgi:uncharacterized protein YbjQ (UPF0145 family)
MYDLIVFLALLLLGYGVGQFAERRHYRSIIEREAKYSALPAIASRYPPVEPRYSQVLVTGSTVVSVDYFKRFLAALRNLFGGRITPYESLLDRARRESLLRMKEKSAALGASMVFNVKYETASISKGAGNTIGSIEVLAYGTALIGPHAE